MMLPSERLLESLAIECNRLTFDGAHLMGSSQQAIAVAIKLLEKRELGYTAAVRDQIQQLCATLTQCLGSTESAFDHRIAELQVQSRSTTELPELERLHKVLVCAAEKVFSSNFAGTGSDSWARLARTLTEWEVADLRGQLATSTANEADDTVIDAEKLMIYLQDRFEDPTLSVGDFRALMGGFGKQTFLFSAEGRKLRGDYVIRRDASEPFVDNDCHRIDIEFQMIRAARSNGFPAPEALWVDTRHRLLPGGHFLVMRRANGSPGGDVFGSNGGIRPGLTETLARILAHLHSLPVLSELASLNESTNAQLWLTTLDHCVRQYLESWRSLFLNSSHLPSPATLAQFGWLLDNLPKFEGHPVLLHGDIGFHNFLFDGDELTAVLDWEFAHLGDPAEDLAYVRNTIGGALDWPAFISAYQKFGGRPVDEQRIRFFQIWGHLRNACAGNLAAAAFANGTVRDLKMVLLPHAHVPTFLSAAQALIDQSSVALTG